MKSAKPDRDAQEPLLFPALDSRTLAAGGTVSPVSAIYRHHDHFDADELMEHLRPLVAQRKVSRPTVYRTLAELVEGGMLRKMALGGRSVYEHEYGYPSHDHLYCQNCNQLIEFQSAELERIRDAVAKQHRFQVLGHRMFVTGICAECRRQRDV
jgi:Fur family ferric uptake transcriptional regulator